MNEEFERLIHRELDGEITPAGESRLAELLAGDPALAEEARAYRRLGTILRAVPPVAAPAGFAQGVLQEVPGGRAATPRLRLLRVAPWLAAAAVVVVAVALSDRATEQPTMETAAVDAASETRALRSNDDVADGDIAGGDFADAIEDGFEAGRKQRFRQRPGAPKTETELEEAEKERAPTADAAPAPDPTAASDPTARPEPSAPPAVTAPPAPRRVSPKPPTKKVAEKRKDGPERAPGEAAPADSGSDTASGTESGTESGTARAEQPTEANPETNTETNTAEGESVADDPVAESTAGGAGAGAAQDVKDEARAGTAGAERTVRTVRTVRYVVFTDAADAERFAARLRDAMAAVDSPDVGPGADDAAGKPRGAAPTREADAPTAPTAASAPSAKSGGRGLAVVPRIVERLVVRPESAAVRDLLAAARDEGRWSAEAPVALRELLDRDARERKKSADARREPERAAADGGDLPESERSAPLDRDGERVVGAKRAPDVEIVVLVAPSTRPAASESER